MSQDAWAIAGLDKVVEGQLRTEWKAREHHAELLEQFKAYDNAGLLREWSAQIGSGGSLGHAEALWVLLETRLILVGFLPAPPFEQTAAGKEQVRRTVAFRDGTDGWAVMVVCGATLLGERLTPTGGPDPDRLFVNGATLTKAEVIALRKTQARELSDQQKARLDNWLVAGSLLYHAEESTW